MKNENTEKMYDLHEELLEKNKEILKPKDPMEIVNKNESPVRFKK